MSPIAESQLTYNETTRRSDTLGQLEDALLGLSMILSEDDFALMVRELRMVAWRFSQQGDGGEVTRSDIPAVVVEKPGADETGPEAA